MRGSGDPPRTLERSRAKGLLEREVDSNQGLSRRNRQAPGDRNSSTILELSRARGADVARGRKQQSRGQPGLTSPSADYVITVTFRQRSDSESEQLGDFIVLALATLRWRLVTISLPFLRVSASG